MLKIKIEGGVYRISFHKANRLNSFLADSLREELVKIFAKPGRDVVLSMKGINFIDSAGIEAIMTGVNQASERGSRFRITDVSADVYELLQLRKFKILFEINPKKVKDIAATA
jgi:anti-anti-sigma factor